MMKRKFSLPLSRTQLRRDVEDELTLHLTMRAEALEREGLSSHAARAEAERLFGNADAVRADLVAIGDVRRTRAAWWNALDELRQDMRFAMRSLRRDLTFALVTACILAMGIGATTALFSLYEGIVLRPLAVADPDRVLWLAVSSGEDDGGVSPAAYFAWRERARTLERVASVRDAAATLLGVGAPLRLEGLRAGDGFFETLGIRPVIGRPLTARDHTPGAEKVVVLGYSTWIQHFGGDSSVVGRGISIDGETRIIVGVLPGTIDVFGAGVQFLLPDALDDGQRANWTPYLAAIGRLKPGMTVDASRREIDEITRSRWAETRSEPVPSGTRVRVIPLADYVTASFRDRVALLFAGVLCVLLIGCVNVANLLLSRGAIRGREMALRASLGASRGRLVRQLLTENAVLALMGGVLGLGLGAWLVRGLVAILPQELPRLEQVRLDGTATAFAAFLTLATVIVSGLIPAIRAARVDLRGTLQGGGRGATAGSANDRLRRGFVVAQVALTTVLLIAAGLLVRSSAALGSVSPGFSVDSVFTARYSLPYDEYNSAERVVDAHERIRGALRERLGERVALSSAIPLTGGGAGSDFYVVGGEGATRRETNGGLRFVTPGYLRAMGITLIAGRDFDERDRRSTTRAIIISESLARALGFASGNAALGRAVAGTASPFKDSTGTPFPWEIVGVVQAPRDWGLRADAQQQVFMPLSQTPSEIFDWHARTVHIVVRGADAIAPLTQSVGGALHRIDPKLPLYDVRTMRERLRATLALEQTNTLLLSALGLAALVLAITGLYGVISYSVAQREAEIGVRLALGAQPRDIVGMITRWGGSLAVLGLVLGLPLALAAARTLRGLLFGITSFDPLTVGATIVVLACVAMASAAVPAGRAARIPPGRALRS